MTSHTEILQALAVMPPPRRISRLWALMPHRKEEIRAAVLEMQRLGMVSLTQTPRQHILDVEILEWPEGVSLPPEREIPRERKCLMCGEPFKSDWCGNRVCKRCRELEAWRS